MATSTTLGISPALYKPSPIDPVQGLRADLAGRLRQLLPDRQSGVSGEEREGDDRRDQGESRQVQLRVGRQRQPASPVHGGAEDRVRPRDPARAVQGHAGGADRSPRRQHPGDVLRRDDRGAEHPGRQGRRARHVGGEADARCCRERAADRRHGARIRLAGVAGHRRAGRHAEGDRRAARGRAAEDPGDAGIPRAARSSSAWSRCRRRRPSEFAAIIAAEQPRWAKAIKDSGAKVD